MGTWQIGTATQLGFLLIIVGMACAFRPYETAKWHQNNPDIQERLHKRVQSHRPKKQRVAFDPSALAAEREPVPLSVLGFRVLGGLALAAGVLLTAWSLVP